MAVEPDYLIGPFRLDMQRRRLVRDGQPVALNDRHFAILCHLVIHAGDVFSKQELIDVGWKDVAVTDNSLAKAISSLRQLIGSAPDGSGYIDTVSRLGYRFTGPVETTVNRESDEALASRLEPFRMFVEGRAAVETLERDAVARAVRAFDHVAASAPDYAPAHLGLANALALTFDATRFSQAPDVDALERAVTHAREACRLEPDSGEAWATLGFVLSRAGVAVDAVAACRRATALDPENWRHTIRLAYVSWGDERLRAARATLQRLPSLGLARWLAATVHVARQAFDDAARELVAGAGAQDAQPAGGRFGAVGLHLLLGLVKNALGDRMSAEGELAREIDFEGAGHIYSPQACASAWYARGAMHLHAGHSEASLAAFVQALERAPGHPMALAAMAGVTRGSKRATWRARLHACTAKMEARGSWVDAAAAAAVDDVLNDRPAAAASRLLAALAREPMSSSAGWGIPADPLLQPWRDRDAWQVVLATIGGRAA